MTRLATPLRQFARDQRGGMAAIIAAATVPLIGFAGLAIDTGRAYLVKSHLSSTLDAAALAGGKTLNSDVAGITAQVKMYIKANFPDGLLGADISEPTIDVSEDNAQVVVTATAQVEASFMRVLGFNHITVSATTEVTRSLRGMELALVMDNTGSMYGSKMSTMKDAAKDLVDILYGDRETVDNFWVSLVPYTATINIGTDNTAWLSDMADHADAYAQADYDQFSSSWKGCVEARSAPNDQNDEPPATEGFPVFYYQSTDEEFVTDEALEALNDTGYADNWSDNDWSFDHVDESDGDSSNQYEGPNVGCPPAITPLVAEKSTVVAAIDEMAAWHRGGTMGNLGLVWGWRTLSPKWRGVWDTEPELPKDYDEEKMDKVVVMLTDGVNQWYDWPDGLPNSPDADYTAYGRPADNRLGTMDQSAATTILNARMLAACQEMKDNEIIIYTITFQVGSNTALKDLYRACATDEDKYYDSPTNADLSDVFQRIATELSNLRLSK